MVGGSYIGENYSGDDEDGKFFTIAKKIRDDLLEEIQIPSWYAIYDELMLFQ